MSKAIWLGRTTAAAVKDGVSPDCSTSQHRLMAFRLVSTAYDCNVNVAPRVLACMDLQHRFPALGCAAWLQGSLVVNRQLHPPAGVVRLFCVCSMG